jgi:hypothetical protein
MKGTEENGKKTILEEIIVQLSKLVNHHMVPQCRQIIEVIDQK